MRFDKTQVCAQLPGRGGLRDDEAKRQGPRQGSLGRKGGGRTLSATPDETVIAGPVCCARCQGAMTTLPGKSFAFLLL